MVAPRPFRTPIPKPPATNHPCLVCRKPATWQSPTGHWGCDKCRSDIQHALDGILDDLTDPRPQPVDLRALMSGDPIEHEYLSEPLVMKGKQTALTSFRGDGKSLLALDLSAHTATGTAFLDQPDGDLRA